MYSNVGTHHISSSCLSNQTPLRVLILCFLSAAIVDSVDNNIQASRRLLLLYNASTFTGKSHTSSVSSYNKNNISKNSDGINHNESRTSDNSSMSFDGSDEVHSDMRQQLECVAAMHRALLDASLKVRKKTFMCILDSRLEVELSWRNKQSQRFSQSNE